MRRWGGGVGATGCALALLLFTTGCASDDQGGRLAVSAGVNVCAAGKPCVALPAAGASVTVYEGSHVVARGKLDEAGQFTTHLPAGSYSAAIELGALGLTIRKGSPVQVGDGADAEIDARFPTPLSVVPDLD